MKGEISADLLSCGDPVRISGEERGRREIPPTRRGRRIPGENLKGVWCLLSANVRLVFVVNAGKGNLIGKIER